MTTQANIAQRQQTIEQLNKGIAEMEVCLKKTSLVGTAINGAILGTALSFFVHSKGERHVLKHAAWGAGLAFVFGYVDKKLSKGMLNVGRDFSRFAQNLNARDQQQLAQQAAQAAYAEQAAAEAYAASGMFSGAPYEGGGFGSQWPDY